MATQEACAPLYNLVPHEPRDNIARAGLICLPESVSPAGRPLADLPSCADEVDASGVFSMMPQSGLDQVSAAAARLRVNIIYGAFASVKGRAGCFRNCSVFIGRDGRILGSYFKRRPVEEQLQSGALPGAGAVVVDSDCGRVGLLICFDINLQQLWVDTATLRCDFIVWMRAFEGGECVRVDAQAASGVRRVPLPRENRRFEGVRYRCDQPLAQVRVMGHAAAAGPLPQ